MKKIVLIFTLFLVSFSFAQEKYKYVIIPSQFSFFKQPNKFGLNELTKSFFVSQGFEVYYDDEKLPEALAKNRCLALYANPVESNTLFVIKVHFEVKDCANNLLLKTELATTREKDHQKAYNIIFRQALSTLKNKLNFTIADQQQSDAIADSKTSSETIILSNDYDNKTLFAIPTSNGYKLVNDKPEAIFTLMKTSNESIFTAQKGSLSGVLIKKNDNWFFEYYEGEKLISEKVEVRF